MKKPVFKYQSAKKLVDKSGYTRWFVAQQLGITRESLSLYLNGSSRPGIGTIGKLEQFLNLPANSLLTKGVKKS